jgi:hypothetical protein
MEEEPTQVLKSAMENSGKEIFVLLYSKHLWKKLHKPFDALKILQERYEKEKSDNLLLALQKMYRETQDLNSADKLISGFISDDCQNQRVWLQAIQL